MTFSIERPLGDPDEDRAITALLLDVFAGEGYTDRSSAERMSAPDALRQRGDLLLAKSGTGDLLGMVVCAPPTSPARQVAEVDEAELHLLAVRPLSRGKGIAAALVAACERRAAILGYARVVLSTQPGMQAAQRVYERLGYRRHPARDWSRASTGKRYLVYEKTLS